MLDLCWAVVSIQLSMFLISNCFTYKYQFKLIISVLLKWTMHRILFVRSCQIFVSSWTLLNLPKVIHIRISPLFGCMVRLNYRHIYVQISFVTCIHTDICFAFGFGCMSPFMCILSSLLNYNSCLKLQLTFSWISALSWLAMSSTN